MTTMKKRNLSEEIKEGFDALAGSRARAEDLPMGPRILEAGLLRLASMEAFVPTARMIDPEHDAELLARIDFAGTLVEKCLGDPRRLLFKQFREILMEAGGCLDALDMLRELEANTPL